MADSAVIDAATKRLALALDALEAAVERRADGNGSEQSVGAQLHALGADRARLAAELDEATARAREVETTNREIARRIEVAIDGIRGLIDSHER